MIGARKVQRRQGRRSYLYVAGAVALSLFAAHRALDAHTGLEESAPTRLAESHRTTAVINLPLVSPETMQATPALPNAVSGHAPTTLYPPANAAPLPRRESQPAVASATDQLANLADYAEAALRESRAAINASRQALATIQPPAMPPLSRAWAAEQILAQTANSTGEPESEAARIAPQPASGAGASDANSAPMAAALRTIPIPTPLARASADSAGAPLPASARIGSAAPASAVPAIAPLAIAEAPSAPPVPSPRLMAPGQRPAPLARSAQTTTAGAQAPSTPTPTPLSVAAANEAAQRQEGGVVRRGDTVSNLLDRHHVPLRVALAISRASRPVFNLARRLGPGSPFKLFFDDQDNLTGFDYPVSAARTLQVRRAGEENRFSAEIVSARFVPAAEAANPDVVLAQAGRGDAVATEMREMFSEAARTAEEAVRNGDNLTSLLGRRNVSYQTTLEVARAARPVYDLARRLQPGRSFKLAFNPDGDLAGLSYPISSENTFWLTRDNEDNFVSHIVQRNLETRLRSVTSILNGSLFVAGRRAGLSQQLAVNLASLFEWDVDFARDIRTGDRFTVIYEQMYENGEVVRDGEIVAAEFVNRGERFRAVRYTDPSGVSGYFDPDGHNVQKMFIRAPVDFTRISSRFSRSRRHPVFGFTRAHKGVDYAAAMGTPIRAAGNGTIIFRGRKGSFGNLVLIRHNATYTTAYAHMSAFAPNLRVGSRVRQGEFIGRVGMTGAATGPHLHYEVRVNGRQVNPLSIQLPSDRPITQQFMADFQSQSRPLLAMLDNQSGTVVAALDDAHR